MTRAIPSIFLSFVFSEYRELVGEIEQQFARRPVHRRYRIDHLARGGSSTRPPLRRSIECIDAAVIVVLLLGRRLGSRPAELPAGPTAASYIEHEADHALSRDKLVVVDVSAWGRPAGNAQAVETNSFRSSLVKRVTIGDVNQSGSQTVAEAAAEVVNQIEMRIDELESSREFELDEARSPLFVSGYTERSIALVGTDRGRELAIIYNVQDEWGHSYGRNSADEKQRQDKEWTLQNLGASNSGEAIRNLKRIRGNYGSDVFAGFWLSRLLSRSTGKTYEKDLKEAVDVADIGLRAASGAHSLRFIASLLCTHAAVACRRSKDETKALSYADNARRWQPTFESREFDIETGLIALMRGRDATLEKHVHDEIRYILDRHWGYYQSVVDRLAPDYTAALGPVMQRLRTTLVNELAETLELQRLLDQRLKSALHLVVDQTLHDRASFDGKSPLTILRMAGEVVGRQHLVLHRLATALVDSEQDIAREHQEIQAQALREAALRIAISTSVPKARLAYEQARGWERVLLGVSVVAVVTVAMSFALDANLLAVVVAAAATLLVRRGWMQRGELVAGCSAIVRDLEGLRMTNASGGWGPHVPTWLEQFVLRCREFLQRLDDRRGALAQRRGDLRTDIGDFSRWVTRFERVSVDLHRSRHVMGLGLKGVRVVARDATSGAAPSIPLLPDAIIAAATDGGLAPRIEDQVAAKFLVSPDAEHPRRWHAYFTPRAGKFRPASTAVVASLAPSSTPVRSTSGLPPWLRAAGGRAGP